MSIVNIDKRAYLAIVLEMTAEKLSPSVRIEIRSTGCCDAPLGLRADEVQAVDLVEEIGGKKFLINSEVYALVGDVSISLYR